MMRLVTFVAVLDMAVVELATSIEVDDVTSSAGNTPPGGIDCAPVLALPKVNFHLDGFLVTGAGDLLESGSCFIPRALSKGAGKTNIEAGSWGLTVVRDDVDDFVPTERCEGTMEVLLISLAKF
jgi:hypothetical protein